MHTFHDLNLIIATLDAEDIIHIRLYNKQLLLKWQASLNFSKSPKRTMQIKSIITQLSGISDIDGKHHTFRLEQQFGRGENDCVKAELIRYVNNRMTKS